MDLRGDAAAEMSRDVRNLASVKRNNASMTQKHAHEDKRGRWMRRGYWVRIGNVILHYWKLCAKSQNYSS